MSTPRDRLPTLAEVLNRRTAAPLDLYCYYLFLQREGAEDTLDFWLDVQAHENLCRAYFKDLRKSGKSVKSDWPQYYEVARRRGSIFNTVNGIQKERLSEKSEPQENDNRAASISSLPEDLQDQPERPSVELGVTAEQLERNLSPTLRALYPNQDAYTPEDENFGTIGKRSVIGRKVSQKLPVQPYIKRNAAITRSDLIASAELIYARYLLSGADKEIYLPPPLRIHSFPLSSAQLPHVDDPHYEREAEALAKVPDMFHQQKEYVYRQMEQDTFPRFLRAKSFGNLTPLSSVLRLGIGLLALWAAFATAFSLIFLDSKPRSKRLWIILPFAVAILCLVSHSYDLDPILVFLGQSETTPFKTLRIREPYIRKLLLGRAVWVTLLTIVITAVLVVIFVFVPGHRLTK